ncbi:LacI family DNA-binding transcriptional regulator [Microbacterium sp. No. 7]|uniref:LacI family DNA-binding transcriptional regulator n=1 Tax=Microbacterium sp. No. 7 TaxID=1714373 RepID=UPI003009D964
MSDVARQLGISRSAVSFALNNEAQVSRETRERVIAKAAELGYRPNAGARALAGQKTDLFGLVTDIVSTPFAGDLIAGAQEWFWNHGKSLIIAGTATPERPDARSIEMMLEHRVGGIMIATTWNRPIEVPASLAGVPVVLVHCFDASGERPSVIPDERQGGREAARMLLARGRRRLAMINLPDDMIAAQGRLRGFEDALAAAGIELVGSRVVTSGAEADEAYEVAHALLSSGDIDGVFCANDRIAMGTYDAARDLGLSIPGDLSVVGFDNQETIAKYIRPALSTVALPFREMGRRGAALLTRSPDELDHTKVVVPCPPIVRNSV